ncbi:YqjK family protein [uncultured Ramlibacter sp.]|uniref:YqjK family protein n=1 Tax=uncultured Ramlibacter sp. TaxID=260755 RepID=UPI002628C3C4|nr:YqjK family protein [uncultured Ramlibacter sp.]
MWSDQDQELQRRQAALRARSDILRGRLGEQTSVLERPLALADRARSRLHWLAEHPQWLALPAALAAAARPGRALGWALKGWSAWRMWRQVTSLLR